MRAVGASYVHDIEFVHGTVILAVNRAAETCIESYLSASTDKSSEAENVTGWCCVDVKICDFKKFGMVVCITDRDSTRTEGELY